MIRRFQTDDLEDVMLIWLNANIEAHHFVDPGFWRNSFDTVKAMIPQAEVYVSYEDGINGFVGIIDNCSTAPKRLNRIYACAFINRTQPQCRFTLTEDSGLIRNRLTCKHQK